MGELIAFKRASGGAALRTAPVDQSTVVVFTGVRQERAEIPQGRETKSGKSGRALQKQPKKCKAKPGTLSEEQGPRPK